MNDPMLKGSCLCGGGAYEMRPPFAFFHYCHCSRCRKSSGSAHSTNILVRGDQFAWTRGEDLVKRYEVPEAEHYCTGWCSVEQEGLPRPGGHARRRPRQPAPEQYLLRLESAVVHAGG